MRGSWVVAAALVLGAGSARAREAHEPFEAVARDAMVTFVERLAAARLPEGQSGARLSFENETDRHAAFGELQTELEKILARDARLRARVELADTATDGIVLTAASDVDPRGGK